MTTQTTPQSQPLEAAALTRLSPMESPPLDERLWQAWVDKNEKRDKMKFARRVKVLTILVVLAALALLAVNAAGR